MEGILNQKRFYKMSEDLIKVFKSQRNTSFKELVKDNKFMHKVGILANRYSIDQLKNLMSESLQVLFSGFLTASNEITTERNAILKFGFAVVEKEKNNKANLKSESSKSMGKE